MTFADVVREAPQTEAPHMPDENNCAFKSEFRAKVNMQSGIGLLTA